MSSDMVRDAANDLITDRLSIDGTFIWGLKMYFSTRFVQAKPSTPNLFQTSNAIHALLDAYQATGDSYFADVADKAVSSCLSQLGVVGSSTGRYCRYYPEMEIPVYNVNASFSSCCLRLSCLGVGKADVKRQLSEDLLAFVLRGQRPDGSWPYADDKAGQWVDGYHTGYVLEALGYFLISSLRLWAL